MGALAAGMGNWRRYLELQVQAKSGLSSALVIGGLLGMVSGAITFVFLLIAAFVWLAQRYDPLIAGLGLGALFLLITIAMLACLLSLVASPHDPACGTGTRGAPNCAMARSETGRGSPSTEPCHRLAQDAPAVGHRRSGRRRCDTMDRAGPA
jgi:hypothetical protein